MNEHLDLDAIEARCEAATSDPWEVVARRGENLVMGEFAGMREIVAECADDVHAEFIAHARTDIPTLTARVRELQAALGRVKELSATWDAARLDLDRQGMADVLRLTLENRA